MQLCLFNLLQKKCRRQYVCQTKKQYLINTHIIFQSKLARKNGKGRKRSGSEGGQRRKLSFSDILSFNEMFVAERPTSGKLSANSSRADHQCKHKQTDAGTSAECFPITTFLKEYI